MFALRGWWVFWQEFQWVPWQSNMYQSNWSSIGHDCHAQAFVPLKIPKQNTQTLRDSTGQVFIVIHNFKRLTCYRQCLWQWELYASWTHRKNRKGLATSLTAFETSWFYFLTKFLLKRRRKTVAQCHVPRSFMVSPNFSGRKMFELCLLTQALFFRRVLQHVGIAPHHAWFWEVSATWQINKPSWSKKNGI